MKMKSIYELTPIQECKDCPYRNSQLRKDLTQNPRMAVVLPIDFTKSCNLQYCLVDKSTIRKLE